MRPGMRAFNAPTIFATAAAMCGKVPGDHRLDPAIAQCPLMPLGVIVAIGVDHAQSTAASRASSRSTNARPAAVPLPVGDRASVLYASAIRANGPTVLYLLVPY